MTSFAKINAMGKVKTVIEASQFYIDSLDDHDSYVQTWIDANGEKDKRYNYAEIGSTFDPMNGAFIASKPYPSWSLDSSFKWQPPIPMPADGTMYLWSEVSKSWIEATYV